MTWRGDLEGLTTSPVHCRLGHARSHSCVRNRLLLVAGFSSASGLKGDDVQYWHPLEFVEREVAGLGRVPVPEKAKGPAWLDAFELDLSHLHASGGGGACETDGQASPAPSR